MIITHTSNPSIDYYIEISDELVKGIHRASDTYYLAGGKGLNVSMILNQLEIPSVATAFIGGFTGSFISQQIKKCLHIEFDPVLIEETNRINVKIRGKEETDINDKGPMISKKEQEHMLRKFERLKKDDWLLICGSFAQSVSNDFIFKAAEIAQRKQAHLVLDVPGINAEMIASCSPYLIKPNVQELYAMFNLEENSDVQCVQLVKKLKEYGVKNILLSKGAEGAEFYNEDGRLLIIQPALQPVNTVGSGDSMLATVVGMLHEGKTIEEALAWGAAAGAATAISKGLATRSIIEKLKKNVIIKQD